jgi:Fe-S-cluster containining protein
VVADAPVLFLGRNATYAEHAEANPCEGCSAPCCRLTILPQAEPRTFRALDSLRYLVAHEDHELLLDRKGQWKLSISRRCRLLTDDNRCSVHDTPAKPKICVFFNPHGCWYKRNFQEVEEPPDLIRMDLDGFERVVSSVHFDADGNVIDVPPFDELRRLAAGTAPSPTL